MKAILIRNLIVATILLIGTQVTAQSLLSKAQNPIVVNTNCEGENTFVDDLRLAAQPDTFVVNNFNILTYRWTGPANTQTGSSNTYNATETGAYVLTVDALRLRDSVRVQLSDTIRVVFEAVCCEARVPNAFTPNGDSKNDLFAPVLPTHCNFQAYELQVYNRWGKKVFDTNLMNTDYTPNTVIGWDGKIDGKDAPSDVYVYWLRYTAQSTQGAPYTPSIYKGNVTLIR